MHRATDRGVPSCLTVLRDGDSLLTTPRPVCLNEPGIDTHEEVARESQATRRANLIRIDDEVTNPARDTVALNGYTIDGLNALLGRYRPPPVDSVLARRSRARIDSLIRSRPPVSRPSRGFSDLLAAGDSMGARRVLAQMDSSFVQRGGMTGIQPVGPEHSGRLSITLPSETHQRPTRGQREAAARLYRRVVGLWAGGDDDLQPVVDQARAKLGSLSRRP